MDERHCEHDHQLETVGGVFLTGAYVCRRCSFRIGMSHEQFRRHAIYPGHYQADVNTEQTLEERASQVRTRYRQRLEKQLTELTTENLPCQLSQDEHDEILTEVIEEALREVVRACTGVARHSALSDAKAVADLIERTIRGRMREFRSHGSAAERSLGDEHTTCDRSSKYLSQKDRQ